MALKRLAAHYGSTQRAVLEALIVGMESELTQTMSAAEQKVYYDGAEARRG